MPDEIVELVIAGALLAHGIGHGGALGALIWIGRSPRTDTGGWRAARSWLLPSLSAPAATTVACTFWTVALLGFVATALSFWGVLVPGEVWRPLAVASAIISTLGIALFFGTWPRVNTVAALGMDIVAVLVALAWPP